MAVKQTEAEARERRAHIVTCATDVFLRYGHARTTMGDIAERAKLSRPVVYLVFPNKDEIFAAVIERMQHDTIAKYREATAKMRSVDKKLLYCCEQWAGDGFELTHAHPDARDVFNLQFEPVRTMYDALAAFLGGMIGEEVANAKLGLEPQELALMLLFALRGLKDLASSADEMRRLIQKQVGLTLAALAR